MIIPLFTFNMVICINGKWFLPNMQFPVLHIRMEKVAHNMNSRGEVIFAVGETKEHAVILDNDTNDSFVVPMDCGAVLRHTIDPRKINMTQYYMWLKSDNITDYRQAVLDALGIDIWSYTAISSEFAQILNESNNAERKN